MRASTSAGLSVVEGSGTIAKRTAAPSGRAGGTAGRNTPPVYTASIVVMGTSGRTAGIVDQDVYWTFSGHQLSRSFHLFSICKISNLKTVLLPLVCW
jgi:hypothetical protein